MPEPAWVTMPIKANFQRCNAKSLINFRIRFGATVHAPSEFVQSPSFACRALACINRIEIPWLKHIPKVT